MNNQESVEKTTLTSETKQEVYASYQRFDISQRIEHVIFLTSFSILGITGLVQKFIDSPVSLFIIEALGGIDNTRVIHHIAAFVLLWVSVYHVISVLYRIVVLRVSWSMLPVMDDFKHLFTDIAYYLGMRDTRAYYGRYNYAEKVEYLAVVWGTIIMAITGFMMWNPITTAKFLPGEIIPAAKAAHGAEAILAVLAILIWHVYNVHIKHFNKSIFTGKISHEMMEEEHPAELAAIEAGKNWQRPPEDVIRRRQRAFIPVAIVMGLVLSAAVIGFILVEPATAITTIPKGETASIFVPITPTPLPTPEVAPTSVVSSGSGADSWDDNYSALFANRCGTCHVRTAVGGLSLATYQSALRGGDMGPAIVPGNPDASILVQVQSEGGHPGQLTQEELDAVISWIKAGAPEK
jgi:cytochrome b subunit of formate dehydrogenase